MKYLPLKYFALVFLTFTIAHANAQKVNFDSLKRELAKKAPNDTARFTILGELADGYSFFKPDSTIYYSQQGIILATKLNNEQMLASSRGGLAYELYIEGNYSGALNVALLALQYDETGRDMSTLANVYNLLGNIYKGQENYPKAITYYRHCLNIAAANKDTVNMGYAAANLSTVFEHTNVLDSALYYLPQAEAYSRANHNQFIEFIFNTWGDIYLKLKDYKKALSYLQKSRTLGNKVKNIRDVAYVDVSLSKYYKQTNNIDSAVYWAKDGITTARSVLENKVIYQASDLLWGLYESKHQTDSAFKYLKLSSITKDSLYSTAKFQAIDAITTGEGRRNAEIAGAKAAYQNNLKMYGLLFVMVVILIVAFLLWRNSRNRRRANNLLHEQKEEIAAQRDNLGQALEELQVTQSQLIQREKMASLGELTAGIAHEIQNPLNFVNNFSEVNKEMFDELEVELKNGNIDEALAIAADIKQNEEKILHHGKRADFIVKGMLQHSRTSTGEKQLTDINVLADEFFKLSYHGLRAKDKSFNAELVTNFDKALPKVNIAQQDIGRVLLNLFNNAFYAVNEKKKTAGTDYKPTVTITTFAPPSGGWGVKVRDNGNGIPDAIKDKIMQPFFTTKPTGEGTGLGLSLSYDIVVKGHNGNITVNTKEGEFTEFTVIIPVN